VREICGSAWAVDALAVLAGGVALAESAVEAALVREVPPSAWPAMPRSRYAGKAS
jgi:hypothetical protein